MTFPVTTPTGNSLSGAFISNPEAELYVLPDASAQGDCGGIDQIKEERNLKGFLFSSLPGHWFDELQDEVRANGISPITFLPVLGLEGYIRRNRSHLLASYPKGGKTELMVNIIYGWQDEKVLYVSEEGEETWEDRAYELPDWPTKMLTAYSLGHSAQTILNAVEAWDGSVVVIDTIKLLGIEDENDAAKVQAALTPFIKVCRDKRQTLLFIHHDNKHGGKGGRGIAGSHAFVGIVDIFLELDEVANQPNQRILSGRGKIRNIEGLLYERKPDGMMAALGTATVTTELTISGVLSYEWQTTADLAVAAGYSTPTVTGYLLKMAARGLAERSPPVGEQGKGKDVRWRRL